MQYTSSGAYCSHPAKATAFISPACCFWPPVNKDRRHSSVKPQFSLYPVAFHLAVHEFTGSISGRVPPRYLRIGELSTEYPTCLPGADHPCRDTVYADYLPPVPPSADNTVDGCQDRNVCWKRSPGSSTHSHRVVNIVSQDRRRPMYVMLSTTNLNRVHTIPCPRQVSFRIGIYWNSRLATDGNTSSY